MRHSCHVLLLPLLLLAMSCGLASQDHSRYDYSSSDFTEGGSRTGNGSHEPHGQPGVLTAGEWRDLDHWAFWRGLFAAQVTTEAEDWSRLATLWQYDTAHRFAVLVTTAAGPVVDARVHLVDEANTLIHAARSDSLGRAELFAGLHAPQAGPFRVRVFDAQGAPHDYPTPATWSPPIKVVLPNRTMPAATLDLMFVIDTTGSMGDEIRYLKTELRDVIHRVATADQNVRIRTSINFYRDHDDEYLVKSHPFTEDVDEVQAWLDTAEAAGGGDYPEAVEIALADAVDDHQWSSSARSRLIFLVLDAPPRTGPEVIKSLHRSTAHAAAQGIRIVPVVASGADKPTEFLMRFLAISTGGTYVFLTDDSGIGDPHLVPTIGDYEVRPLNDLLVEVIARSLQVH